jgi:hypothetical protein
MTTTTFVGGITPIAATWLNDINATTYVGLPAEVTRATTAENLRPTSATLTAIGAIVTTATRILLKTSAGLTATLPTPVGNISKEYKIKAIGIAATVATAAGLIEGAATLALVTGQSVTVISDGTNWYTL